jgi:hypothetical protein
MTVRLTSKQEEALDFLRTNWPDKAEEIERLLAAEPDQAKRDAIPISVSIKRTVAKYEGEYQAGKDPVEVVSDTQTIGG